MSTHLVNEAVNILTKNQYNFHPSKSDLAVFKQAGTGKHPMLVVAPPKKIFPS